MWFKGKKTAYKGNLHFYLFISSYSLSACSVPGIIQGRLILNSPPSVGQEAKDRAGSQPVSYSSSHPTRDFIPHQEGPCANCGCSPLPVWAPSSPPAVKGGQTREIGPCRLGRWAWGRSVGSWCMFWKQGSGLHALGHADSSPRGWGRAGGGPERASYSLTGVKAVLILGAQSTWGNAPKPLPSCCLHSSGERDRL